MRPFSPRKLGTGLKSMLEISSLHTAVDVVMTVAAVDMPAVREFLRDLEAHDVLLHEADGLVSARLSLGAVKICARQGAVKRIRLGAPSAPVVSGGA